MTTPILVLILFAAWTILMVLLVGFYRWKCVFTGTVPKGGFPSDIPPEDGWYRRALQAHKNCVENLAVYAAIVLVISFVGLTSPVLDNLAIAIIVARVAQSLIHVFINQTRPLIMVRFTFFLVQIVAFIWMIIIVIGS
ncbi:MAG: MAPEG family protein [Alphaproteobacteria bacterium]